MHESTIESKAKEIEEKDNKIVFLETEIEDAKSEMTLLTKHELSDESIAHSKTKDKIEIKEKFNEYIPFSQDIIWIIDSNIESKISKKN